MIPWAADPNTGADRLGAWRTRRPIGLRTVLEPLVCGPEEVAGVTGTVEAAGELEVLGVEA